MKEIIKKIPFIGNFARRIYWRTKSRPFTGSEEYWEQRYGEGGNSGVGSHGKFAEFKAEVINGFVAEHDVESVIEFGCGDGNQLELARYPSYLGFDVSETAVSLCRQLFENDESKDFRLIGQYDGEKANLTLSLDVIYHLTEDAVFEKYMKNLFDASNQYVIIYSSDSEDNRGYEGTYIKHRVFTNWVKDNRPDWKLSVKIPNKYPYHGDYDEGSFADFFVYEKV